MKITSIFEDGETNELTIAPWHVRNIYKDEENNEYLIKMIGNDFPIHTTKEDYEKIESYIEREESKW